VAGLWSRLAGKIDRFSRHDAIEACHFANIVGGLTTTKRGAINALPRLSEIDCETYPLVGHDPNPAQIDRRN